VSAESFLENGLALLRLLAALSEHQIDPSIKQQPANMCRELVASDESPLQVYSTGDGHDVYEDQFMEVAKPNGRDFLPTLILVGTRLGIDKITPVYWEALIAALQMPQSVGIAG
jgi:cysteine protease ATG4